MQLINENYKYRYNIQINVLSYVIIVCEYVPIYLVFNFNNIFLYRYKENVTIYILKN